MPGKARAYKKLQRAVCVVIDVNLVKACCEQHSQNPLCAEAQTFVGGVEIELQLYPSCFCVSRMAYVVIRKTYEAYFVRIASLLLISCGCS
jgi:hypothetical protein